MQTISSGKILYYVDRIFGENKPIVADIFLTNYCNNNCPYCTYKRWDLDSEAYSMKYEDFIKYSEKLIKLGVQGIILTGGGEPTLCNDFEKITKWLENNNIHYGINTNFNKLKYFKPDYLKVSLDAYDNSSYINARGVDAYDKVKENIYKYAEWKIKNSSNTKLGIQLVAKSIDGVEKFYNANKDLPVDYISIRPIESTNGSYYKNIDYNVEELKNLVKTLASYDSKVIYNFKWDMLQEQEDTCIAQWAQIALNEKGQIIYCCHKPYEIIGHILDDDVMQKKSKAYNNMNLCDIPCRLTAPNKEVSFLLKLKEDICFI